MGGKDASGGVRMGQKSRPNYWKNAALLTGSDVVLPHFLWYS